MQTVEEFVLEVLNHAGVKGIARHSDSVTSQCPCHLNKNNFKTFRVSTVERNFKGVTGFFFNCFSCGFNGMIPTLVAKVYNIGYEKACRLFEKRVALNVVTMEGLRKSISELKQNMPVRLEEIILPPSSHVQKPMVQYLARRNKRYHGLLDIDYIIHKYGLYYCSTGRMSGRIIMPVKDIDGTVVGYNDRAVDENATRKSLHPKGLPYGRMLHGLYENRGKDYSIVTEGSFDMFAVDCALCQNKDYRLKYGVVNLMGLSFCPERIDLLIRNFDEICLMLDNDDKGIEVAGKILRDFGNELDIVNCTESYPKGKDPGKCTGSEILKALDNPIKKKSRSYLSWIVKNSGLNFEGNV